MDDNGAGWVILALLLGFLAVVGGNWYLGASAIAVLGLTLWAVVLYPRVAAVSRRTEHHGDRNRCQSVQ